MNTLGLGLMGYGGFGQFSAEAMRTIPGVAVAAVADVSQGSRDIAAQRFPAARLYTDAHDLLNDRGVDIVVINTPPSAHAPLAAAAARAGKHIFCEKPLAVSLAEADDVIASVRQNNVRLTLNYVLRHNVLNRKLAGLLRAGVLGGLHHMSLENWATDEPLRPGHWFWDVSQSGGIWVEHGVHFFDLFTWWGAASAQAVSAFSHAHPDGRRDREWAIVRYSDDIAATYHHAFTQPQRFEQTTIRLACARGYVTLHGWMQTRLIVEALVDNQGIETVDRWAREGIRAELQILEQYTGADTEGWAFGAPYHADARVRVELELPQDRLEVYADSVRAGMLDLLAAIRDPAHALEVTALDGRNSLAVALAASRAAGSGCWENVQHNV
jgi:predicted dehydrogenase